MYTGLRPSEASSWSGVKNIGPIPYPMMYSVKPKAAFTCETPKSSLSDGMLLVYIAEPM